MKLRYRIHEWLADHVSFIQYPNVRRIATKEKWQPFESGPFIQVAETSGKARLSIVTQLVLALYSIILLMVGLSVLAIGGIVLWAILSSFMW